MKDCVLNVVQLILEIFLKVADERGSHQKVISGPRMEAEAQGHTLGLLLVPKEALRQVKRRKTPDSSQRGKLRHPEVALLQRCGKQN